jgi:hypothetical protein
MNATLVPSNLCNNIIDFVGSLLARVIVANEITRLRLRGLSYGTYDQLLLTGKYMLEN